VFNVGRSILRFKFFALCVLCFAFVFALESRCFFGQLASGQPVRLGVVNVDTGLSYAGVQEAINAAETLAGHEIRVGLGVFSESVVVNKSVSLVGENPDTSVIDGMHSSAAVAVVSGGVEIRSLGIRNGVVGLLVDRADDCKIIDNVLYDGSYGLRLYRSRSSFVAGNRVSGFSWFGVELDGSGNTTLRDNWLSQNQYGFGVDGGSLSDFLNDIDDSNRVNGKPIRYLVNQRDLTVDSLTWSDVGFLGFVNSSNIVVKDLEVRNNVQGVLFAGVTDSSVTGVKMSHNWNGVYVAYSRNVSVYEVEATLNFDYGIKFFNSSGSRAFHNKVDSNGWAGIGLFGSSHSVLDLNEASFATYDLHLVRTNNSVITGNTAIPREGGYSIAVYYSHNNSIYHNTFQNSLLFAETRNGSLFTPVNSWNNSVEGNFWTAYSGHDVDDGVGDAAYRVGVNNFDYYPLMGRFLELTLVFDDLEYRVSMISNSTVSDVGFDEGTVSFVAGGQAGTTGFSRVAVPEALIRALGDVELAFLVNGEEPAVIRKWSDGAMGYWYIRFVNRVAQDWSLLWLLVSGVLVFLIVFGVVIGVSRMRRKGKA
jgi:parallel beta-helix repeat protein